MLFNIKKTCIMRRSIVLSLTPTPSQFIFPGHIHSWSSEEILFCLRLLSLYFSIFVPSLILFSLFQEIRKLARFCLAILIIWVWLTLCNLKHVWAECFQQVKLSSFAETVISTLENHLSLARRDFLIIFSSDFNWKFSVQVHCLKASQEFLRSIFAKMNGHNKIRHVMRKF